MIDEPDSALNLPSGTTLAMQRIESVLRKEIGLDAASIGTSSIERIVRQRMKKLGLESTTEYARLISGASTPFAPCLSPLAKSCGPLLLQASPSPGELSVRGSEGERAKLLGGSRTELDELVEAVVVMETWFFRDRAPFSAFQQLALEWLAQHPAATLRALSVPCSSGEEPYSLAIALLDAGVPPNRFVINAVDVSSHALERAKQAIYGKNSFRGKELAFRDRHFRQIIVRCSSSPYGTSSTLPEGGEGHKTIGYALNSSVRECVQFYRDNLLGDAFLAGHTPYDFILCRNLLIYFDRATQDRALEKLHHLLAPEGVLFVGPAELPLVAHNGFVNANLPMAFACRKIATGQGGTSRESKVESREPNSPSTRDRRPSIAATSSSAARQSPAWCPQDTLPDSSAKRRPLATSTRGTPERASVAAAGSNAARSSPAVPSDLDAARQLADAGHLKEAVMVCQAHLRDRGPSAQAYYLLGLVHDASGDPQAIAHYRKALYLEPNHYESLLQMSLLLERTGDAAGARVLKRRAQRVSKGTD